MKLKVYSADGAKSKEKQVDGMRKFEDDSGLSALRDLILAYQANQRQGNANAKKKGEVSGTGKKPWRQKGTGMARAGSRRSPLWPGGGVAHGPRPRDYSKKINRKLKLLGLNRAIFDSATEGTLALIETFEVKQPKTKLMDQVLNKINAEGTFLLIDDVFNKEVMLAVRNLPRVFMIDSNSLNAWDVVLHDNILISEKGFKQLINRINPQE